MGSGDWLRSLVCAKRLKHKQGKVHSASEKSNGANPNDSNSTVNGGSQGSPGLPRKSIEDKAATRIQKAFRAYRARKLIRRIRSAGRFHILIQDQTAQKQTSNALSYIHSWCNVQAQIRNRRLCMVMEGRLRQRKLENQSKLEAKLHELEVEWHNGSETMEEILYRIQQREEAVVKRERAMAYAFSHQWRANSTQYLGQAYYSICKENWGWSWMERWIAARPWEVRVNAKPINTKKIKTKQLINGDKVTNQPELKLIVVSTKPASSNGNKSAKAKKTPNNQIAENQAAQETQ
ncbi:protein IQ-DOMAIN 10-like [Mangifera indica]|uniref:protein IQ-DOMAIN 10-like n=1 Tax=Mangifera indica TaxID=29780 RepID=UPI001CF99011|nr:protein IQ-DOMAIN 10-like [Mangifera indica]